MMREVSSLGDRLEFRWSSVCLRRLSLWEKDDIHSNTAWDKICFNKWKLDTKRNVQTKTTWWKSLPIMHALRIKKSDQHTTTLSISVEKAVCWYSVKKAKKWKILKTHTLNFTAEFYENVKDRGNILKMYMYMKNAALCTYKCYL